MSQNNKPKVHWTTWGYMRTEKIKPKQVAFVEHSAYEQLQSELTAERESSKRLVSLLKSAYGFVKENDNVGITTKEIEHILRIQESKGDE